MISRIVQWSLQNRLWVILSAAMLMVWGAIESQRMPVDVFPDLTAPTVTLLVEGHGMPPEEMEQLVTLPLETVMNGASGVRRVRSTTSVGLAMVWVEFDWDTDIYQARQVVTEKLQLARASLPPELPAPIIMPISSIMGEVMYLALHAPDVNGRAEERHSPMSLKTLADWDIMRRLQAVPGVAQVIAIGGETRQFQVIADAQRLASYGLTLADLGEALQRANSNSAGGFLIENGQESVIQGLGRIHQLEDIENTLITRRNDLPITVANVAEVKVGPSVMRGTGYFNATPAVILAIQKQPSANTLALTDALDETVANIRRSLPEGMQLESRLYRQADFIHVAVNNVISALRDGAILVVLIVAAFLLSGRATFITVLAIPLSLLVAILLMKAFGIGINTMTLGGMAIAVGALVDDAIIDVENIVRRMRLSRALPESERPPLLELVWSATREIQGTIVYATLIIMLVFLPLFFLSGVEGRLMQPLGFAYVISLAASLLVAITLTPVLCYLLLPNSRMMREEREEGRLALWLKTRYQAILLYSLPHWRGLLYLGIALLLGSLLLLSRAGQSFLPEFNEGSLTLSVTALPGTTLSESNDIGLFIERSLLEVPEVVATVRRTGRPEKGEHTQDVNVSEIDVSLKMGERDKETMLEELRKILGAIPGVSIIIGQPISHRIDHMLSGTRANIAVKIFGEKLERLRQLAQQVNNSMAGIDGVVDLAIEPQVNIPYITLRYKREAMAHYGVTVEAVSEAIEALSYGHVVGQVREGQRAFDLVIRYDTRVMQDYDSLRQAPVATADGALMPLHALAEIRRDFGPNTIKRENAQRRIIVMANVAGRDLVSTVDAIRNRVAEQVKLPEGYHISYGGQFESAASATERLTWLSLLVLIGIFLLLYQALHSGRDALLVMLNLPMALIGGVVGVYLAGGIISVAEMIGFISLFGIATRNGVMLIAHTRHLIQEEGVSDFREAVRRGAMERLIPILMTALSAGLALIPLAMGIGEPGSEIQAPMAWVILTGLITSTALNMLLLPALYYRFGSLRPQANG